MSAIGELRAYVRQLQARLRWGAVLRGAAIVTVAALLTTVLLTVIINRFAFSSASVWGGRAVLLLTLALGAALGLAVPLLRLNRRWSARRAESAFPQFEQRLLTFTERDGVTHDPFLELLAHDTLDVARAAKARTLVPDALLVALFGVGAASLGVLFWLISARPGYVGYGAAALWGRRPPAPLYELRVDPGDATVRRHADQLVTAEPVGLRAPEARIYARYRGTSSWERVTMQPRAREAGFQFLFPTVADDLEYYVEVGPLSSRHFHLRVADVPAVKQIRVTYHFPSWTQRPDAVEEHGGDLRAIEGTQAELQIRTDRPLPGGVLVMDDGREIALAAGAGNTYRVTLPIDRDGAYHVAGREQLGREQAQLVRISEDYFIEAGEVKPPEVAIVRPQGDYRASPIEEVTVAATARDEFGLSNFALRYSVNGGPEKTVGLLRASGAQQASGSTTLSLESLHLVPGDVVSFYVWAKDARAESRTDIGFIQAEPFEREFSQSQTAGGGGGGGMGGMQADISRREKEIIAATWQQAGLKTASARQAAEQAKFLADVQTTLRAQALSLSGRLQMRELTRPNELFNGFQQEMSAAAEAMGPAAQQLGAQGWNAAVPHEQKALQHLLRAEATFRQIEVAFGSAAGGGGTDNAGRDLASLFDLELDTQKNQYETGQAASPERKRAEEVDAALRKLDELARRQSELAGERSDSAQAAEQRWQQEMLRRNAEELQRQLEQLVRSGESGSQGRSSGKGASGQGSSADGSSQDSGAESGASGRQEENLGVQRALAQLRQAQEDMRRAVDRHDAADARRAAERLREAMTALGGTQQQQATRQLDALSREAGRLAEEARRQGDALNGLGRGGNRNALRSERELESMLDERQRLADDLARLTQDLRSAEAPTRARSKAAGSKLREALTDLDEADVETRLQRSADLLRRGYAPRGDQSENDIQTALQRLTEQLAQARQAMSEGGQGSPEEALASVERFRSRLAALDPGSRGARGEAGGSRGDAGGAAGDARGTPGDAGGSRGDVGGYRGGPVGRGGYGGGFIDGGWNSGNNRELPRPVAPETLTPREGERIYREGMNELGELRRSVGDDPAARAQVDELIRAMQRLDPRRFPGNPAMVEELYARVHTAVDRLELSLRREPDEVRPAEVRSEPSPAVPPDYQAAVAEYFRRLSKNP
jgi:hypothetical protein